MVLAFLTRFTLAVFEGTFVLHVQKEGGLGPVRMGIVFVECGLVMGLSQAIFVGPLIQKIGEE